MTTTGLEAYAKLTAALLSNPDCTCDQAYSAPLARECGEQLPPDEYCDSCNRIADRLSYTE